MEREKQPYVSPMNGTEALAMFGDRRLLDLEEQRTFLGMRVDEASKEIATMQMDPEADWEEITKKESELEKTREKLKETNLLIRKAAQDFGTKRGPLTL